MCCAIYIILHQRGMASATNKGTPASFTILVLNPPLALITCLVLLPSLILLLLFTFSSHSLLSFLPPFRSPPSLILISSLLDFLYSVSDETKFVVTLSHYYMANAL
jgi:hypothetical protein